MAKDFTRSKEYRALKKSLEDSLAARGLVEPVYADMVRRYLSCREMEHAADLELNENGINIWDERRGSFQLNPAVSVKNNAMRDALRIYRALGFEDEAKLAKGGGGDDDEL